MRKKLTPSRKPPRCTKRDAPKSFVRMKYWIMPEIIEWTGLIGSAVLLYPFWLTAQDPNPDVGIILGMGSLILALMAITGVVGHSMKLRHMKNILKKNGLWQDELIKKNELQ